MIEQMNKVSIVLLNKEKEAALKSLRKIGLVHLEKIEGSSEKLNAFKEYSNNAIISESILSELKLPKQSKLIILLRTVLGFLYRIFLIILLHFRLYDFIHIQPAGICH